MVKKMLSEFDDMTSGAWVAVNTAKATNEVKAKKSCILKLSPLPNLITNPNSISMAIA